MRRRDISIADISIANEEVVLTQSDMHASNFGVSPDGRPIIFDAATIQALPVTLADFTLLRTTPFATEVSKNVFREDESVALLASPNIEALTQVRRLLFMSFDDSLGTFDSLPASLFVRADDILILFRRCRRGRQLYTPDTRLNLPVCMPKWSQTIKPNMWRGAARDRKFSTTADERCQPGVT